MQDTEYILLANCRFATEVFQHLAKRIEYREPLRHNPYIPPALWIELYEPKLKSEWARALLKHPLNEAQIEHVFSVEKRPALLCELLSAHKAARTPARLIKIADLCRSTSIASILFTEGLPKSAWHKVAPYLRGMDKLAYLCYGEPKHVSDKIVVAELRSMDHWWGKNKIDTERRTALAYLLHTRPHLFKQLIAAPVQRALAPSLAASRLLLSEEDQFAVLGMDPEGDFRTQDFDTAAAKELCSNPVARRKVLKAIESSDAYHLHRAATNVLASWIEFQAPYEELDDVRAIHTLMFRLTEAMFSSPQARFDLLVLAKNPNLTTEQKTRIKRALLLRDVHKDAGSVLVNQALAVLDTPASKVEFLLPQGAPEAQYRYRSRVLPVMTSRPSAADLDRAGKRPTRDLYFVAYDAGYRISDALGSDPHAYELFLSIAGAHYGTLDEAIATTKRLLR